MEGDGGVDAWAAEMRELLDLEREAELESSAARLGEKPLKLLVERGVVMDKLRVQQLEAGFMGRTVAVLGRPVGELPPTKISTGDIVAVHSADTLQPAVSDPGEEEEKPPSGVVTRLTPTAIHVAFDGEDASHVDAVQGPVRLAKLANDVTFRRYAQALSALRSARQAPCQSVIDIVFRGGDLALPRAVEPVPEGESLTGAPLNESQRAAIALALAAPPLSLIHGPPGTGKTTTVVELIVRCAARGERVLAAAPSNVAADNMAERLIASGVRGVVRVGHPARLLPAVLDASLDAQVSRHPQTALASDARSELRSLLAAASRARDRRRRRRRRDGKDSGCEADPDEPATRASRRAEVSALRREVRDREQRAAAMVLGGARVVVCTCVGAAQVDAMRRRASRSAGEGDAVEPFDVVVVDEAAQSLAVESWVPLLQGRRAVLAGDHHQLPPTVLSPQAERRGLGTTLFARGCALGDGAAARLLDTQYRMHATLCTWASDELYGGRLHAHPSVAGHTLADLRGVDAAAMARSELHTSPMAWIDTAGCAMEEEAGGDVASESRCNAGEARLAALVLGDLLRAGMRGCDIGLISPYAGQVAALRELVRGEDGPDPGASVEISTVDGFQGREKEVILLSLVRSNRGGRVGFLADDRRTNVAATRARRHLCVIGDAETVASHPFLARLHRYTAQHGRVCSALELEAEEERAHGAATATHASHVATSSAGDGAATRGDAPRLDTPELRKVAKRFAPAALRGPGSLPAQQQQQQQGVPEPLWFLGLTAARRARVHAFCQRWGLGHAAVGPDSSRRLCVWAGGASEPDAVAAARDSRPPPATEGEGKRVAERAGDADEEAAADGVEVEMAAAEAAEASAATAAPAGADARAGGGTASTAGVGAGAEAAGGSGGPATAVPAAPFQEGGAGKRKNKKRKNKKGKKKDDRARGSDAADWLAAPPAAATGVAVDRTAAPASGRQLGRAREVAPALPEEGDDWAVLEAAARANTRCASQGCRKKTVVVGTTCAHCRLRYCYEHGLAESHGCGRAAKAVARASWLQQQGSQLRTTGAVGTGLVRGSSKADASRRAAMEKKLSDSLGRQESSRRPAQKAKKKKGKKK